MRAQIGQNIDPRLGILDFSPQADAARTRAAGQMALGSAIGEALTDYKARRDEEKNKRAFSEKIAKGKNSYMLEFLGFDDDDLKDITADEVYGVIEVMDPKEVQTLDKAFFLAEKKAKAEAAKNLQDVDVGKINSLRKNITENAALKIDDKNGFITDKKGNKIQLNDPRIVGIQNDPAFINAFPGYRNAPNFSKDKDNKFDGFSIAK
jgi:hypothetical protein